MPYTVAALYRFAPLADLPALKAALHARAEALGIRGTILIAPEGVNGTIAGSAEAIDSLLDTLDSACGIRKGEVKFSTAEAWPFSRLKIRIRQEIITMRAPEADPSRLVGTYVEPSDWNALIADPDVTVIDTRNRYETRVGTFERAIDPEIDQFTDFKAYVETLDPHEHPKVAMFCTGGIRCEKASAFMLSRGFDAVFHLKGGILKYLEEVPAGESRWQGDCYVFDARVAVGHGLSNTEWGACHGCGAPLTADDRADPAYEEGVSCPHCSTLQTPERASRLRERQRQMSSVRARGA